VHRTGRTIECTENSTAPVRAPRAYALGGGIRWNRGENGVSDLPNKSNELDKGVSIKVVEHEFLPVEFLIPLELVHRTGRTGACT
jgi:hypothetical protein